MAARGKENFKMPPNPPEENTIAKVQDTLFDRVIAPLTRESFISEFWGQSFLRLAGHKGKFEFLLSWEELNSILEQHHLKAPRLRLIRDGKPIDPGRYLAHHNHRSKLRPAAFINNLSEGATMILGSIDELAPAVGRLTESWQEVLRSRTTVNLYAGWRTQKGFDLHWDPQDTMILQVSGRKHWKVYSPTRLNPLEQDEKPAKPSEAPVWAGILEDGDMLYIPRGWWHVAFPLDEPSLHLTVTIVPANGVDLLRWLVEQLKGHADIRMNVPHLARYPDQKRYVARLRELLMQSVSDDVLERFMAEWEASIPMRPRIRLPMAPTEARTPMSMGTNVRLASCRRMAFVASSENGTVSFVVGGFKGECAADLVPALKLLSGTVSHSMAELCAHLSNQTDISKLMILITALAMRGAVQIESRETT